MPARASGPPISVRPDFRLCSPLNPTPLPSPSCKKESLFKSQTPIYACPGFRAGGDDGIRTHDPLLAGQVLSQLSYTPIGFCQSLKIEQQYQSLSLVLSVLGSLSESLRLCAVLHRKEVIQPHLPIRLPCYDLTPVIESTFDGCLLAVSSPASGVPNSHGLTGGVYKARERIHRSMLTYDY